MAAIESGPAQRVPLELYSALPDLPCKAGEPVFKAPWEAQAFAMTLALHERGLFTWKEWTDTLAQVIRDAQVAGDPDTGESYYEHWLDALERIAKTKGLIASATLTLRKDEWREAARRTPHGKPIELKQG